MASAGRRLRTLLYMLTLTCRRVPLLLLCGLAVMAPVAAAEDNEIFVDPDSPTGREYELPIDRARERAAPSTEKQRSSGGTRDAPLFGSGVEADGAAPAEAVRDPAGTTPPAMTSDRSVTGNGAAAERAAAAAGVERRAQAAADDGVSGLAAVVGLGAAVLLVGGLVGLLLRRRAAR